MKILYPFPCSVRRIERRHSELGLFAPVYSWSHGGCSHICQRVIAILLVVFSLLPVGVKSQTVVESWAMLENTFYAALPKSIAVDGSGNVYTGNWNISTVSKITPDGVVSKTWVTLLRSSMPEGLVIDGSGNIYTLNNVTCTVSKITPAGVLTQSWATLPAGSNPKRIAIDGSGNVYIANKGSWKVNKITPDGTVAQSWSILSNPVALAVDGSGNVYTANANNTISKITTSGNLLINWVTLPGNPNPRDMAVDGSGNIFVANANSSISKITPDGVLTESWAGLSGTTPVAIAISGSGYLFTVNTNNTVSKITPAGAATPAWAVLSAYSGPQALVLDGSSYIYTANMNDNTVSRITFPAAPGALSYASSPLEATYGVPVATVTPTVTGEADYYSISPALPAGLSIDSNSGEISGTPTELLEQADFTVTASNPGGSATTTFSLAVVRKPLTITGVTAMDKVYDGDVTATLSGGALDGVVGTDDVGFTWGTGSFSSENAGAGKLVTAEGFALTGSRAGMYSLTAQPAGLSASITLRDLTVTATASHKTYDGNTSASVTLSDNRVSGDALTKSYTSVSFQDKNVGAGKAVTVSGISISGADAANYNLLNTTATAYADIVQRPLTATATASNKTYDGNTSASVALSDNRVQGDVLDYNYTAATFADKNVGAGKTVSVSGISISGPDAANYYLTNTSAQATASISALGLTVRAIAGNKPYDGDTRATITLDYIFAAGDNLTINYASASFNDKNAGTQKPVTVLGISMAGADAANYNLLNTTATAYADILASPLTVTANDQEKTYGDANPAFTMRFSGFIPGEGEADIVRPAMNCTAQPDSPAGDYPVILAGGSAANYALTLVNGTLTVRKAQLTVKADNKERAENSNNPELTFTYTGFKNADGPSVLDVQPTASTTALASSPAGSYPISLSGGVSNRYDFTYVGANLLVVANHPPFVSAAIDPVTVKKNSDIQVSFARLFADPDAGQALTYGLSVEPAAQGGLPSWVLFNTETMTLTLSPRDGDLGSYRFILSGTDPYGLKAIFELPVVVEAPTGASSLWPQAEIRVYPNPSSGIINLDAAGLSRGLPVRVVLTNASGARVYESDFQSLTDVVRINLSGHPVGAYLLTLTAGNHQVTKKILLRK